MHIYFISSMCSRKKYVEICEKRSMPLMDSSQKFFDMFVRGFSGMESVTVDCIGILPVTRGSYPERKLSYETEQVGNITYHYVGLVNFPVVKTLSAERAVKKLLNRLIRSRSGEESVIICDPLLLEGTVPGIRAGKKFGIDTVGFLTDMPDYADECDNHHALKKLMYDYYNKKSSQYLQRFDSYIFLTEYMREAVGKDKPWMLMECIVDPEGASAPTPSDGDIPTVLYAGKLHRQFGLDILLESTRKVKSRCRFELFGDGNYREELEKAAAENPNLILHGIVPVEEAVAAEKCSTLLINPRTSVGVFTKYSFPSKTAEYMLTGVPVVMFRLPGIPGEYSQYLLYAEEETADGFARAIDGALEKPHEALRGIGKSAQEFMVREKNNHKQAQRLLDFVKQMKEDKQ